MLAGLAEGRCFCISKKTNKVKKAKQLLLINKTK